MGGGRGMKTLETDRKEALGLILEATVAGARKEKCCEVLGISLRTVQRWERCSADRRKGPAHCHHKLTDEEKEEIIRISNSPEYRGLSPEVIVARLADQGIYLASERSFYRVLKAHKLLNHRGKQSPNRNSSKPLAVVAEKPNTVWSWDITYLKSPVRGLYYYLYMVMDVYSRMIVGWSVHEVQCSKLGSSLIKECCKEFSIQKKQLILHSDNGGPMKGATMLATLQKLGVVPSFNRPAVSDDNPFSEALFKTLKYRPSYPDGAFKGLGEANEWVSDFVQWYNYEHLHSEIKYTTPASRHYGKDHQILTNRKELYEKAKQLNPLRWKRKTRDWEQITKVQLNPHGQKKLEKNKVSMAMKTA